MNATERLKIARKTSQAKRGGESRGAKRENARPEGRYASSGCAVRSGM
jgi:hypothetical protein